MTGLWQVSGRSELDFDELVRLDFLYLERWSVFLDLTILLKTMPGRDPRPGRLVGHASVGCLSGASLPLPLRADGAARAAPEVQGLGAGGALVLREPARADGGLRAGLLASCCRVADIPDYPLFLLVGLIVWVFFSPGAAGRRAEPGDQRAAGAQGALPARDDPRLGGHRAARDLPRDARRGGPGGAGRARVARPGAGAAAADRGPALRAGARASRWRSRCCTPTTATSSRCSAPRCCRGSSSRRSSCRSRTCPA